MNNLFLAFDKFWFERTTNKLINKIINMQIKRESTFFLDKKYTKFILNNFNNSKFNSVRW